MYMYVLYGKFDYYFHVLMFIKNLTSFSFGQAVAFLCRLHVSARWSPADRHAPCCKKVLCLHRAACGPGPGPVNLQSYIVNINITT